MLACEICFQTYNEENTQPVVLPCGHTFCSSCWKGFRNICPQCRKEFQDDQVNKNFLVFGLLEAQKQLQVKEIKSEESSVHKKGIDNNLRDEIDEITNSLKTAKLQKQTIEKNIAQGFQAKVKEVEKEEVYLKLGAQASRNEDFQKIHVQRDDFIQKIEEDARQKIEAIEKEKQRRIQEANMIAEEEKKKSERNYQNIMNHIMSHKADLMQKLQSRNELLRKKLEIFKDLEELKTDTLSQCIVLYQSWEAQKFKLQEIIELHQTSAELLFDESLVNQQQNEEFKDDENERNLEEDERERSNESNGSQEESKNSIDHKREYHDMRSRDDRDDRGYKRRDHKDKGYQRRDQGDRGYKQRDQDDRGDQRDQNDKGYQRRHQGDRGYQQRDQDDRGDQRDQDDRGGRGGFRGHRRGFRGDRGGFRGGRGGFRGA